jgi:hypothetical protein
VIRMTMGKALLYLVALCAIPASAGCVVASASYTEDNLPRHDSDGSYVFHGYVATSAAPVRMQARGSTSDSWATIRTVNASTARTYTAGLIGDVFGYYWQVTYALNELKALKNPLSHVALVRFVTLDDGGNEIVMASSTGDVDDCYFGARLRGDSPYEAGTECLSNSVIRVTFTPPPPPPPDCPPQDPECHENIASRDDPPWSEGVGNGTEGQ